MRARYPDQEGFIERPGARLFHEVHDNDGPTTLLTQTSQIVHQRHGKMQIPYIAAKEFNDGSVRAGRGNATRYGGAVKQMAYREIDPDSLASAIAAQIEARPNYLPVDSPGALNAARLISELV